MTVPHDASQLRLRTSHIPIRRVALRTFELVEAILRDRLPGIAKPEPLK